MITRIEQIQGSRGEKKKEEENRFLLLIILNFRLGFQALQAAHAFLCSNTEKK